MDYRYEYKPCPDCNDPWCAGCEEAIQEECDKASINDVIVLPDGTLSI